MAQLAILGHATRGREVIEILEMLGGKNRFHFRGDEHEWFVLNGNIQYTNILFDEKSFTLEEFLENYPYKVGDKVQHTGATSCGTVYVIERMGWANNHIEYKINPLYDYNHTELVTVCAEDLQPYKEAPMYLNAKANKQAEEIAEILEPAKEIMEEIKLDIPDGYEFFGIDDDNKIVLTKKQPLYPNTYERCCDILDAEPYAISTGYKSNLILVFHSLLISRDAYWKIAGKQMGLGIPWKPDFLNPTKEIRYFIFCTGISIEKGQGLFPTNKILIFPTVEMRDAFYENFKELIELCKELL